jgi:hypothetical protein
VFQQFSTSKQLATEAKESHTELCAEWDAKLNLVENKMKTAAFRQCIYDAWKDISNARIIQLIEDGCDLNFRKIYLMQHFQEQIQWYTSLTPWSTEIGQSFHQKHIKNGFNALNKTGDYYTQIIKYYLGSDTIDAIKAN